MRVRRRRIEELVHELLTRHRIKEPPIPVDELARKLGLEMES
jgi:hypothetical protein